MFALRLFLIASIGAVLSGCAAESIFPPQPPASFADYPVTGTLGSISVADLEAITAAVKPNKIYGVGIGNHDAVSVQIAPLRRGSQTSLEFKRVHGRWQKGDQIVIISCLGLSTGTTSTVWGQPLG